MQTLQGFMVDMRDGRERVRDALKDTVARWGTNLPKGNVDPRIVSGESKVEATLAAVSEALSSLGKKPDRDGCRAYLEGLRSKLTAAREAFQSVGADCQGPAALALAGELDDVLHEGATAQSALNAAPPDRAVLTERNVDVQMAAAKYRDVAIKLARLNEACRLPELPPIVAAVAQAKQDAEAVTRLIAVNQPARALEVALDQGARLERASRQSPGREALELMKLTHKIAVCFEGDRPAPLADAFKWRLRRFQETAEPTEGAAAAE